MTPLSAKLGVLLWLLGGLVALVLWGCAAPAPTPSPSVPPGTTMPKPYKVGNQWYQPLPDARGFTQQGRASWYGRDFHGRRTSNGETYNMYAMTAAHKTLPFETRVRVKNLENNKETVVRINDRGPFVRGRIIDLSYTAAQKIDLVGPGTARVAIVALHSTAADAGRSKNGNQHMVTNYQVGNFTFQVGAFRDRRNAELLKQRLAQQFNHAHIVSHDNGSETLYRVRVERCSTLAEAQQIEQRLIRYGFSDTFTVAE